MFHCLPTSGDIVAETKFAFQAKMFSNKFSDIFVAEIIGFLVCMPRTLVGNHKPLSSFNVFAHETFMLHAQTLQLGMN